MLSGEGNGNPLQYSCLENSMDGEPGGLQSMGSQRVRHDWVTDTHPMLCLREVLPTLYPYQFLVGVIDATNKVTSESLDSFLEKLEYYGQGVSLE